MFFKRKKKTLVLYYSQSMGNTKKIAEKIAEAKSYDIEPILTIKKYTGSYDDIMTQGKEEVENGYRPELQPLSHDLSKYDRIIIGSPTWWYTISPAVSAFLENNSLAGKTVIPFVTFGGYEGHSLSDLEKACGSAKIINPKSIQFDAENLNQMVISDKELDAWIQSL